MSVHIEGMGWLGSALAYTLTHHNISFTWHDINTHINAWQASTGLVYPAGDARSLRNLEQWQTWHDTQRFPKGTVTPAVWAYANTNPPFKGRHTHTPTTDANVAHAPCYAVDAPTIVNAARHDFAAHRRTEPPPNTPLVRAHGFHNLRDAYLWGWSAPVRLELPDTLTTAASGRPIALYGRAHKWAMAYAYPIPTRPGWHWAGSTLTRQHTPKRGNAATALARWRATFTTLFPRVTIHDHEPPTHGWRPQPTPTDPQQLTHPRPGVLQFPALWHSGVRWSPELVEQAAAWCAQPQENHP